MGILDIEANQLIDWSLCFRKRVYVYADIILCSVVDSVGCGGEVDLLHDSE